MHIRRLTAGALRTWLIAIALMMGACSGSVEPDAIALADQAHALCLARRGSEKLVPTKPFRTDGCTLWPDSDWRDCCVVHDMDYWCGGSADERREVDRAFRECVADTGHSAMGTLMSGAVRIGGTRVLPSPWRWAYGWPWVGPMERDDETPTDER